MLCAARSAGWKRSWLSLGGSLLLALVGGLTAVGCGDDGSSNGANNGSGGAGASGGGGGGGGVGASGGGGAGGEEPVETVPPSGTELIRVNQVGYLPAAAKVATVVAAADKPHAWELVDAAGAVVDSGATRVVGDDAASGEHVHTIDFSDFTTVGEGYTLRVGSVSSHPFDVSPTIYSQMKYDALAYFYHNRSGIEILEQYVGPDHARPAGHKPDQAPCGEDIGCTYTLDVTGGWYDAGDHGKYVVNGGISAWTLLNQYERFVALGSTAGDFGDGKLKIPENENQIPDLLDEARWEIDFMLKMQVPQGETNAGMVHHKVHDLAWTGLPLAPHEDPQPRFLRPVSTAATLNLAATAAQAARIWKELDPTYSAKCLEAAKRAWTAAKANPRVIPNEGAVQGGGAYGDSDLSDEFYWAAAELFLTTGDAAYQAELAASDYSKELIGVNGTFSTMTWGQVDGLGAISLAVVPAQHAAAEREAARTQLIAIADKYLEAIAAEGYRVPFDVGEGGYPWGSNSFVLNNMLVLALAHDFTGEQKYFDGVASGADYLLGRNPMDKSYVSGYGENPLQNPHHRFWAAQVDPEYPSAPPGAVSGGPNSGLEDEVAQEALDETAERAKCTPQKCYLDDIGAWSVNEITINWNSPFAWTVAWLDEKAKSAQ
ncbi:MULTISPECIES: glycoside hydrolase family 9 protein [Sorangium]|uniref:Endoglucanase n=1 Tax=Sorangium cellulosum TaxID=56 RepID=A0A4P2QWC8_SORCE|nr:MULTISPECIES: glycoside hydrolase family 9 protein [Sorangium]AUX34754.1 endoglucanase [Sorangium cellulosum]WCQ94065.1 Cellulose 1,4-beta-cellobiosidase [Sorangium sp. Soce836]